MRTSGFAVTLVLCGAHLLFAQTASQRVTFEVRPLNRLAVSGTAQPMVVNSATPGEAPTPVSASGGTYSITTNEVNRKITAALDARMPTGVTLEVAVAAPGAAASAGAVALSTTGTDVVTGITPISASDLPITYRLSATTAVLMPAPETRVVTFTIIAAP